MINQSKLEHLKWHLIRINHYLKWAELILIKSKDWINFDSVLELGRYTSPDIQYYHVSKIKQYAWLIYSWIINEFDIGYYPARSENSHQLLSKFEPAQSWWELRNESLHESFLNSHTRSNENKNNLVPRFSINSSTLILVWSDEVLGLRLQSNDDESWQSRIVTWDIWSSRLTKQNIDQRSN
jgi:hypothetical protein